MKTKKVMLILAILLAGLSLAGCGGGGGVGVGNVATTTNTSNPTAGSGAVRMAGHVEDENGNPVAGVEVAISGTQAATTDGNGDFTASVAAPGADGTSVRLALRKAGYIETFKNLTVTPDNIDKSIYSATLKIVRGPDTPAEATLAEITLQDGSTRSVTPQADSTGGATVYTTTVNITGSERAVTFATPKAGGAPVDVAFTIGSADGSGANAAAVLGKTGNITGSVTYGNPTDQSDLETFPGDFTTKSDMGDGESGEGALITAGFVTITLRDADGQPITKFADGQTAKIKMNVPVDVVNPETGAIIKAGDTIPVFVFNEDTSEWIVEHNADGSVKRTTVQQDGSGNLSVQFETSHLTTFNLDWKGALCPYGAPVINIADSQGQPVTGATIYFNSPSGWTHYPATIKDSSLSLNRAPADIEWQVWAKKDALTTQTATIKACGDATLVFNTEPPKPKCLTNTECEDGNLLTLDKCVMPGQTSAVCVNYACSAVCNSDASCGDGNSLTNDTCMNPGTCSSYCSHSSCQAACVNHSDCADANPDTTNKCVSGGTCGASCVSYEAACDLKLDKVNYSSGETMKITFAGSNAGPEPVMCGAASALKRGQSPAVWNSFDENLFVTIPANTASFSQTITKAIPADWVLTTSSQGSDYDIYTVHTDGAFWTKGDNFNIHVDKPCGIACSADTACDDGDPLTTDSCVSPGTCSANCAHNTCPVSCAADATCDDGNPLTIDVCNSPGTCSASCGNTACEPACASADNCDDSNALTIDTCDSPDTCAAACAHSVCTPACINDANCDDGNALTADTCANPDTCSAACVNTTCSPVCATNAQCDDGNTGTNDICNNPNTCAAACANVPIPNNPPTATASANVTSGKAPLSVTFTGGCSDTDGVCVSYAWNFGDGSATSTTKNTTHTFTAAGTYNVILTVTDDGGATAQSTATIIANPNLPPKATASASSVIGGTPFTVNFTGGCSDTDGYCASYLWNFGDGSPTSSQQKPSHTFTIAGTFSVALTVTDSNGAKTQTTINITVKQSPTAAITSDVWHGDAPLAVNFTGICADDGACVSYLWNFGDGSPTSSLQNTSHTFTTGDTFAVTLTVTDDQGYSTTATKIISTVTMNMIAAGSYHTCAVTSGGSAKCWGQNVNSELGDGTTTNRLAPVDVSGLSSGAVAVSAGMFHTCALTEGGGVKCWGSNGLNQLGNGTTTSSKTPVDVTGLTSGVTAISAGTDHACALMIDGGVKCWGHNVHGAVGNGTTYSRTTPTSVTGLTSGVRDISAGGGTCALTVGGGVKCWGWNVFGQVGDGTKTDKMTPVNVIGLVSGVKAIAVGDRHACALTTGGGVKCWGNNTWGQLGDGTMTDKTTPVDVTGLTSGVSDISAKSITTCALMTGGGVKCWGFNGFGQIGDGTTTNTTAPVDVSGWTSGVIAVSAGYGHTCALMTGGGAKCLGYNGFGQIGDDTWGGDKFTPVDVVGF